MARFYRRRRFARRLRRAFRGKRKTMARIKKDIMKCNFPTKVKFMGLTEKKVMFLTKTFDVNMETKEGDKFSDIHEIILDPMNTDNINSIIANSTKEIYNWDKMCILGIYIKFQPKKNMWTDAGNGIVPVKCTYNMNVVSLGRGENEAALYDKDSLNYKQVFTFNSNEAFTMYIPAPTTMCSDCPCVFRSKTWWALADISKHVVPQIGDKDKQDDPTYTTRNGMDEDDYESDEDNEDVTEYTMGPKEANSYIQAGRLFLQSSAANYNITINYKVALKG